MALICLIVNPMALNFRAAWHSHGIEWPTLREPNGAHHLTFNLFRSAQKIVTMTVSGVQSMMERERFKPVNT
jgi:hypothetical protein